MKKPLKKSKIPFQLNEFFADKSELVGIDEAGRGALAGPMMMAACKLKSKLQGLTDSKKLDEKKREQFYGLITQNSEFLILAFSSEQIDALGLSFCLKKGLEIIKLHFKNSIFLYDGNTNFGVNSIKTLIKADSLVNEVSAASILAKVSRDRIMKQFAKDFPCYEFEKHKAYGTKRHKELIAKFGICKIHRKSFKLL